MVYSYEEAMREDTGFVTAMSKEWWQDCMALPENQAVLNSGETLWSNLPEWPKGECSSAGVSGTFSLPNRLEDVDFYLRLYEGQLSLEGRDGFIIYLPKESVVPLSGECIYYLVSNSIRLFAKGESDE